MTKSIATLLALSTLAVAPRALAWDPFRVENRHVERGNDRMQAHDADGALHEYEAASHELPGEPGVHLDRGLALIAKGVFDRAREALLIATEPPAPAPIRADAYYDIGVAFYAAGDAAARAAAQQATQGGQIPLQGAPGTGQQADAPHVDHREASRIFREAADHFRRSLRVRPGNRDAAWNLELSLRRIHQEEEAQRQQDEQQQQQQQQQGQQGQQGQDQQGDQNGQQQQDQQQQGGQQGQHDQQQQGQDQNGHDQHGQQGNDPSQQPNGAQGQQDQHQQQAGSVGDSDHQAQEQAAQSQQHDANGLPADVARVLDALPDSTVERARARAQALREDREPAQDW